MMQTSTVEPQALRRSPPTHSEIDHRNHSPDLLALAEIDRASVVDSIRHHDGSEQEGVFAMGAMRELCPACKTNHLKLVLRQKRVRHAHLFCESCNKCYDARYADGSSALEIDE